MSHLIRDALRDPDRDPSVRRRIGKVTSTAPLEVALAGMTVPPDAGLPASRIASYTPVVGDRVLILQDDTDLAIVGRLISGG